MGHSKRWGVGVALVVTGVIATAAPAVALPGTLTAGDVDLPVLSKAHTSTVIVYDDVVPGTCETADETERDAVVASFGTKAGPVLNEIVYEFGSAAEAKSAFAASRTADQERTKCGTTGNATILSMKSTPKGIGNDRYTVTSKENVAGVLRKAIAVQILAGDRIVAINFLDWTKAQPSTKKVLTRALSRLD